MESVMTLIQQEQLEQLLEELAVDARKISEHIQAAMALLVNGKVTKNKLKSVCDTISIGGYRVYQAQNDYRTLMRISESMGVEPRNPNLLTLIQAGLLEPPLVLTDHDDNPLLAARLEADGQITYEGQS